MEPIVITVPSLAEQIIFVAAGMLGILAQTMVKAKSVAEAKNANPSFQYWLENMKANQLPIAINVLAYIALVLVWWTNGIDFLGLYRGVFNGLTFFIGYGSNSIFGFMMRERVEARLNPNQAVKEQ